MDKHPANEAHNLCPECGAPKVAGMNCREQLGAIIAWEYEDAQLLVEHFKTVASYNLQHPAQFTAEALAELRSAFIEHLDNGLPVAEIRKRMAMVYEGSKRALKHEPEKHPVQRRWKMTIADVYLPDHPEGAAQRVRDWAAAIRKELSINNHERNDSYPEFT